MKPARLISLPFVSLANYLTGSFGELKRVDWPNRQTVIQYTVLVTLTIIIGSLILMGLDYGLQQLSNSFLIH